MKGLLWIAEAAAGVGVAWQPHHPLEKMHGSHEAYAFFWQRTSRGTKGVRIVHLPSDSDDEYVSRVVSEAAVLWLNHEHYSLSQSASALVDAASTPRDCCFTRSLARELRGVALQCPEMVEYMLSNVMSSDFTDQCTCALREAAKVTFQDLPSDLLPARISAPRKAS